MKFLTNTILSLAITCVAALAASDDRAKSWLPETLTSETLGPIIRTDLDGLIRIAREAPVAHMPVGPGNSDLLNAYRTVNTYIYRYKTAVDSNEDHLKNLKISITNLWYVNRKTYFAIDADADADVNLLNYTEKFVNLAQGVFKDLGMDGFKSINAWLSLETKKFEKGVLPRELFKGLPKDLDQLPGYVDTMWPEIAGMDPDIMKKDLETAVLELSGLSSLKVMEDVFADPKK